MSQTSTSFKIELSSEDPKLKRSFRGHTDTVLSVAFNPNMYCPTNYLLFLNTLPFDSSRKQLASGCKDSTIKVWHFEPKQKSFKFVGHKAISQNYSTLLIKSSTLSRPLFTIFAFRPMASSSRQLLRMKLQGYGPIPSNTYNFSLYVLMKSDNISEGLSLLIKGHKGPVRSIKYSKDGQFIVTSSEDHTVKIWNPSDRKLKQAFDGHLKAVRTTDIHLSNHFILSGSDDCSMRIWDIEHKQQILGFLDHSAPINSTIFHPNSAYMASAGEDRKIRFYDMRVKKLIQQFDAHSESINSISFHPSGNFMVSASDDSKLKVWDLRFWKLGFTLFGHSGAVSCVTFSPKGDYIASGGDDTAVLVWKSNFGSETGEFVKEMASPNQTQIVGNPKPIEPKRSASVTKAQKMLIVSPKTGNESINFSPKSRRTSQSYYLGGKTFVDERKASAGFKSFEKDSRSILDDMNTSTNNTKKEVRVINWSYDQIQSG